MTGEVLRFEHIIIDEISPENPHIKAAGDIDRDGSADVVVASSNSGPLVWYKYPDWTKNVIAQSGRWSTDAKLADMDGDGDLDIIISDWYARKGIEWYENPMPEGDPATELWKHHVIGTPRAHDVEVGDIDGDGHFEIVTRQQAHEGNKIIVWKETSRTRWTKRIIDCPIGEGLDIGDVDGDRRLDVVIGSCWYEGPKNILMESWNEHGFADWSPDAFVRLADINKDGRLDVVLTRSEGRYRLSWFEAPADPKRGWVKHWAGGRDSGWVEHVVDDSVDFAHSLVICDINNDGDLDIVTAEMHQSPRKRVMVYLNEGNATKWRQQIISIKGSHNICVADIDRNGKLDIIGANWSGEHQPVEAWLQT